MRSWQLSAEARDHFDELLRQGAKLYERETILAKRALLHAALQGLANTAPGFEMAYQRDMRLGLYRYHVRQTPFVIYFSISPTVVYVERIAHYRSDRSHLPMPKRN